MKSLHTFVVLAYKESKYLEECIKSVLNQKYKSEVVIATSTPNDYIDNVAKKYKLKVIKNKNKSKGIGYDFDFALSCAKTELITIAHQDDIYDYEYSEKVVDAYRKYKNLDPIIIFTDYYEIHDSGIEKENTNLKIKRILLKPLKKVNNSNKVKTKRKVIKIGNAISCPAVTFVTKKIEFPVFGSKYKCNVDWNAWEKLSKKDGAFIFVPELLMGHRIDSTTTTTKIINEGTRTKEDLEILKRFWPAPIAKFINHFYKNSEKNNK